MQWVVATVPVAYRCDGVAFGKADGAIREDAGTLAMITPSPATAITVLGTG